MASIQETKLSAPLLLTNCLNRTRWKGLNWTAEEWGQIFGDKNQKIPLRFGPKITGLCKEPQWESTCIQSKMTYCELLNWSQNSKITHSTSTELNSDHFWAYFDYFYMKNLPNQTLLNELVCWEDLGFAQLKAKNSTLWVGTRGANTPCHIDTHGFNIVCQMYGRKRWVLFPKEQSKYLYPTRIPYEETSIYSKVAFPVPDANEFPLISQTTPFVVVLEPGQCLVVPKHWWHFVENIEFSISVNSWIDLPSDNLDSLKEVLTMHQIGAVSQSITCPSLLVSLYNPNMLRVAEMTSSELLELLLEKVSRFTKVDESIPDEFSFLTKINSSNIVTVQSSTFEEYSGLFNSKQELSSFKKLTSCEENGNRLLFKIIEAMSDDRVINTIAQVLREKLDS